MRSNFCESIEIVALAELPICDSNAFFHILTKKSCSNISSIMHTPGFTTEHCLFSSPAPPPLPAHLALTKQSIRNPVRLLHLLCGSRKCPINPDHRDHVPTDCPRLALPLVVFVCLLQPPPCGVLGQLLQVSGCTILLFQFWFMKRCCRWGQ